MCYLCLNDNPFAIIDPATRSLQSKKERAAEIKNLLKMLEEHFNEPGLIVSCKDGLEEIKKLKEEQYRLSREI